MSVTLAAGQPSCQPQSWLILDVRQEEESEGASAPCADLPLEFCSLLIKYKIMNDYITASIKFPNRQLAGQFRYREDGTGNKYLVFTELSTTDGKIFEVRFMLKPEQISRTPLNHEEHLGYLEVLDWSEGRLSECG
jgi:hypothetical protein